MALSKFRNALEHSLKGKDEKEFIAQFYDPSHGYADFLTYYGKSLLKLVPKLDGIFGKRDYQKDNVRQRINKLKKDEERVNGFVTELPAGAGKTKLFVETLLSTAKEIEIDGEKKLVTPPAAILVPTVDLLEQTYKELKEAYPNLVIGRRYGKVPQAQKDDIQPLTIYIYDTFMQDAHNGWIQPGDIRLAILDEAHRCLSETRFEKMQEWKGLTFFDAYSASPIPDDDRDLYALLGESSRLIGPSDQQLTDDGHLAPCHNIISRVRINKKDAPPEIRDNSQRYGDFLQYLKIQAALELYKNYRDPETGQRPFGTPTIGFTRYVRDGQEAGRIFREEMERMAAEDSAVAETLSPYSHLTQVLSRDLLGDKGVDAAFGRILPLDKLEDKHRTYPQQERALATFTRNMATEGTNIPELTTAFLLQSGPHRWQGIQLGGRVRRPKKRIKPGGEEYSALSYVINSIVEEDGKIIGNPMPYYKAINNAGVLVGVQDFTPTSEQIDAAANEVLEYQNREDMQTLVLGTGSIASSKAAAFDSLWKEIEQHTYKQSKKPQPKSYLLDKEAVKAKIVTASSEDNGDAKKTEFRVSKEAVQQFRRVLGIPGQLGAHWLSPEAFEERVIGTGERAKRYSKAFKSIIDSALTHFERHADKPYTFNGHSILMQTRMDQNGNPVTAFHCSGVNDCRAELDVLPEKTRKFLNFDEFSAAVLEQVDNHDAYRQQIAALWQHAQTHYEQQRKPGQRTSMKIGAMSVEVAKCLDKQGREIFCIERKGARAARDHFGIAAITFDTDGISWTADHDEIVKMQRQIVLGNLPEKTDEYLMLRGELPRALKVGPENPQYTPWRTQTEAAMAAGETVEIDGYPVLQMHARNGEQPYCLFHKAVPALAKQLNIQLTGELPEKTDEYLALGQELPRALKIGKDNPQYITWRKQTEAAVAAGETVEIDGHHVLQMESGTNKPYCLFYKAVPALAKQLGDIPLTGTLPKKTDEYLEFGEELPRALKTTMKNPHYAAWRKQTEDAVAAGETVEIDGHHVLQMQSGAQKPYCLFHEAVPALKVMLAAKVLKKTDEYLSLGKELPVALGTSKKNPKYAAWRKQTEAAVAAGETVEIDGHPMLQMQSGTQKPCCLFHEAVPALKVMLFGNLPKKTDQYLAFGDELPRTLGTTKKNPQYAAWRKQTEATVAAGELVEIDGYPVLKMQASNGDQPYCLLHKAVPALKKVLAEMKAQGPSATFKPDAIMTPKGTAAEETLPDGVEDAMKEKKQARIRSHKRDSA